MHRVLPAIALATLMALAGLAAAQGPPNGGGNPSENPGNPEERRLRDCMDRAQSSEEESRCIDEHCQRIRNDGRPASGECIRQCRQDPSKSYCAAPARDPEGAPRPAARHVAFDVHSDGIGNLTVHGRLLVEAVSIDAAGPLEGAWGPRGFEMRWDSGRLQVHDDATGFVRFDARNANATITFPEGVRHEDRPGGSRLGYPAGPAMLEGHELDWTGDRTVVAHGFFSFHAVPAEGAPTPPGPADPELRDRIQAAVARGERVGAEVRLHPGVSEVFAYDRINVTMRPSREQPTALDPLRITFSAELSEGRTVVLHLNRSLLDVAPERVHLRYFTLPDGENGTAQTEVVFGPAASLDDILDPTDDAGQPEYWVVRDANGLQVLVSIPHWSVHMVELSALAELVPPNVAIGIAAGAAATLVAAVALLAPRRRE